MSALHPNFTIAIQRASDAMRDYSKPVHTGKWQGIDISKRPEAQMREVLGWDFRVAMPTEELSFYREDIKPNLPWADDHFAERVCGSPINPGEQWKHWPWANSASEFRDKKGRFEVNYMERFWAAGEFEDTPIEGVSSCLSGIRGRPYGDLGTLLDLLEKDPLTRQAYLPIYHPEDTGAGGRVPCTLGYHFIMRHGYLHIHYPIRSCDFYRHFKDDCYMTVRLALWVLDRLRERDPKTWENVKPGFYSMWIGSFHVFVNDYVKLFGRAAT